MYLALCRPLDIEIGFNLEITTTLCQFVAALINICPSLNELHH